MKNQYLNRNMFIFGAVIVIALIVLAIVLSDNDDNLAGTAANPEVAQTTEEPVAPTPVPTSEPQQPTQVPTSAPTQVDPTDVPTDEPTQVEPTEVPTDEPTQVEPTDVPTDEPTQVDPTDVPTDEPTEVQAQPADPTAEPTNIRGGDGDSGTSTGDQPDGGFSVQATYSCQMSLNDAGDSNPFTFNFAAINTNGIDSYNWDLGDGTTPTGANVSHTYTNTGTFNITLTCVINSGADIVLTGSVGVYSTPAASFNINPSTVIVANSPVSVDVSMINNSSGGSLSYSWTVTGPNSYSDSSAQPEPTFTFVNYGTHTIQLTVTDGAGQTSVSTQTVQIQAPAPSADFSVNPSSGELTAGQFVTTFNGIDNNTGPITSWSWDFDGDNVEDATGQGPHNFAYTAENTYNAKLTYSGPGGSGSVTRQVGVYPAASPVTASFNLISTSNVGAGVRACFENLSTGPINSNTWTFDDTPQVVIVDNASIVCHDFLGEGNFDVTLVVSDLSGLATSSATQTHSLFQSPIANFTETVTTVTWGGTIDFTDTSTGVITAWAWDFDGDGTTDSTDQNPTNIQFNSLGSNPIRLTVTGPGGSSFVEHIIIVQRLDITCSISGATSVLPNTANVPYDGTIGDLSGRGITYEWHLNGVSYAATEDITIDWTTLGSNFVEFSAVTDDGATCSDSINVQVEYQPLTCGLSYTGNLVPDGNNVVFSADVGVLQGRTLDNFVWFVDGVQQAETSNQLTLSWLSAIADVDVRYTVATTDGTDDCDETRQYDIEWPSVTCPTGGAIGTTSGIPNSTNYTWTVNFNSGQMAGRTTGPFSWTLDSAGQAETGNSITRSWTQEGSHTFTYSVNLLDTNGTVTTNCSGTVTIVLSWPTLTCNITGTFNPVPTMPDQTRTYTYTRSVGGVGGRTLTYVWTYEGNPAGTGTTSGPYEWQWNEEGTYNISLTVTATNPADPTDTESCNRSRTITVDVRALQCNAIVGDVNPVLGETATYTTDVNRHYGRDVTYNWELLIWDGGSYVSQVPAVTGTQVLTGGANASFTNQFNDPSELYRLVYTADVINPVDNCSGSLDIGSAAAGVAFSCDAGPTGNLSPNSSGSTYTYSVTIDNTNGYNLNYDWVLVDQNGTRQTLTSNQAITDGSVTSPSINGDFIYNLVGQYTLYVEVAAVNSADTTYTCTQALGNALNANMTIGNLNVDYTSSVPRTAVEEQTQVCLTNTANPTHGTRADYVWTWDFGTAANSTGSQTFTGETPPCFSYDGPGNYTVILTGANGSYTQTRSYVFNVYGKQTITIDRTGGDFGPAVIGFSANGQNLTGTYNWVIRDANTNAQVATMTGANPSQFLNAGSYIATVSNTGPLGTTTAQITFTLLGSNDIRAAFVPSPYGGMAPMNVCFTDRSIGSTINTWTWDFGNGQTLTYDNNNIPAQICTTYTTPATQYLVRLTVSNGSISRDATNVVRTYNSTESNANFTVVPQGNGQYCFTPQVTNGVTVTGWDFGDGTVIAVNHSNQVCNTYSGSGSYAVKMSVTDNGTPATTGEIVRPVNVTTDSSFTPPAIAATASCNANSVATFTLQNTGGNMTTPDTVTIRDSGGNVIFTVDNLQLSNGGTVTYTISYYAGTLTLTTLDTSATTSTNCNEPPRLAVTAACQDNGTAVFTITNTSSDTTANQSYEIRDSSNALIDSGTINVPANGGTATVSVSTSYDALTFSSSGAQGPTTNISTTTDCVQPPVLSGTATCQPDGTAVFTITNTSAESNANQAYEIRDGSNTLIDSGTLTTAMNGGTTVITVPNNYTSLTLTSDGGTKGSTTILNLNTDCVQPPVLSGVASCQADGTTVFTITNTSAESDANQAYEIRDGSNALIDSGTLTTAMNGGTTVLTVPSNYTDLTFTTNGGALGATTVVTMNADCDEPPILAGTTTCEIDGTAVFAISNTSTESDASQPYEVRDTNNNLVQSGTLDVPMGQTTEIRVTGVYTELTFTTAGPEGVTTEVTLVNDCDEPPILSGGAGCNVDGSVTYTIINSSTESVTNQTYEILQGLTVVETGTLTIPVGGTQVIRHSATTGPLTFSTSGPEGVTTVLSIDSDCLPETGLGAEGICYVDGTAEFTLTNYLGDRDITQDYSIFDSTNTLLDMGSLTVAPGQSEVFNISGATGTVSFVSGGTFNVVANAVCATRPLTSGTTVSPTPVPSSSVGSTSYLPFIDMTPGEPDAGFPRDYDWDGINLGGAVCEDWLLYHTFQTNDWEVFRLGDLPDGQIADPNLSQGEGTDVTDMAPSRSPDADWITFTSNRDGNWEIYVAAVDNSEMRRVTFNTTAIDIDPAWSPTGEFIAFESTRDGNWNLYLLNIMTGVETQLTDNEASDINAFWHQDGQRLLFQSDRSGQWQIYEIDITTGEETLLSDGMGEDHDPAYSFDGEQVLYRSFRGDETESQFSVIYVMNSDGSEVKQVSPSNANSTNHTWYMDGSIFAYQSDFDGDLDIYVYEFESEETRLVTDNDIDDFAPTWICASPIIVFTSVITEDANIYNTPALPMDADPILVDEEAIQMTDHPADDVYPENAPAEENASREGNVPPRLN